MAGDASPENDYFFHPDELKVKLIGMPCNHFKNSNDLIINQLFSFLWKLPLNDYSGTPACLVKISLNAMMIRKIPKTFFMICSGRFKAIFDPKLPDHVYDDNQ